MTQRNFNQFMPQMPYNQSQNQLGQQLMGGMQYDEAGNPLNALGKKAMYGAGGAGVGALLGALAGSIIPGAGTAAGAMLGAKLGGSAGLSL